MLDSSLTFFVSEKVELRIVKAKSVDVIWAEIQIGLSGSVDEESGMTANLVLMQSLLKEIKLLLRNISYSSHEDFLHQFYNKIKQTKSGPWILRLNTSELNLELSDAGLRKYYIYKLIISDLVPSKYLLYLSLSQVGDKIDIPDQLTFKMLSDLILDLKIKDSYIENNEGSRIYLS